MQQQLRLLVGDLRIVRDAILPVDLKKAGDGGIANMFVERSLQRDRPGLQPQRGLALSMFKGALLGLGAGAEAAHAPAFRAIAMCSAVITISTAHRSISPQPHQ